MQHDGGWRGNIGKQQNIFGGSEDEAAIQLVFWLLEEPAVSKCVDYRAHSRGEGVERLGRA